MKASEMATDLINSIARGVDREVVVVLKDGTWVTLQASPKPGFTEAAATEPGFTEAGSLVLLFWAK